MDKEVKTQEIALFKATDSNFISDYKEMTSILLAVNDQKIANHFGMFAENSGFQVQYVWSLEGLDFLPLWRVGIAVVEGSLWQGHEAFGRPVGKALQSFKKIFVLIEDGKKIPGGKAVIENTEYVIGFENLKKALFKYSKEGAGAGLSENPQHLI